MTRHPTAAAAAAIAAVIMLGACGGDGGGNGGRVATLGAGGGTSPSASAKPKDREEAMLAFAKCMREQGIDMPDPGDGPVRIGPGQAPGPGSGEQTKVLDGKKIERAHEACREFMDGMPGGPGGPGGRIPAEMQEKLLAMARCMRAAGHNMPDPVFEDGGRARVEFPDADLDNPALKRDQEACREKVGLDGAFGPGGGPGLAPAGSAR